MFLLMLLSTLAVSDDFLPLRPVNAVAMAVSAIASAVALSKASLVGLVNRTKLAARLQLEDELHGL